MTIHASRHLPGRRASCRVAVRNAPSCLLAVAIVLVAAGCGPSGRETQQTRTGAGNYCSLINRVVWASNRQAGRPPSGPAVETFNIFIMDSTGQNDSRLTTDAWPAINQHPVFTSDCKRIVWAHGNVGRSAIWIMNLDSSAKARLTSPPDGEEDGHPWVGADGPIYFVRHRHPSGVHRIWRMNLDGSNQTEIIGGQDIDRFHPNLRREQELILYTAGPPGSGKGDAIRVFNQRTREDTVLYKPGWPVSAAIWHPDGDRAVAAEDHDANGRHRIVEIGYPGGGLVRTLTDDAQDNTIPYYAYPSGAAIDWVRWPGGRRPRGIAHMNADGSGQTLLTGDAFEHTKIVGEPVVTTSAASGAEECEPRAVGCYPTPPPCAKVLLPDGIKVDAEGLGEATGQAHRAQGKGQQVAAEDYLTFMRADVKVYLERSDPRATADLQKRAQNLQEFLSSTTGGAVQERVADIYVNTYLAELSR